MSIHPLGTLWEALWVKPLNYIIPHQNSKFRLLTTISYILEPVRTMHNLLAYHTQTGIFQMNSMENIVYKSENNGKKYNL